MTWEGVMKLVELRRKSALFNDSQNHFSKDQPPKPKIFPEQTDDGMKTLHDARFLRCPLAEPETWWKKVPTSRPHLFKNIPLSFMGAQNKIADKTIGCMHDRAKPLTLKNFSSQNACVSSKPMKRIERKGAEGLEMIYDYAWEDPSSMSEVTESLLNYSTVLQQLWPYDPTALIMLRLINKYKWINVSTDMKEKISVITMFFNSVLQDNAGRSVRGETVLNCKEQEEMLKTALIAHNLQSSVPTSRPRADTESRNRTRFNQPAQNQHFNTGNFKIGGRKKNFSANSSGQFSSSSQSRPRASFNNLSVCYSYNSENCKNPPSSAGCKNGSRELAHVCNVWMSNQNAYCLASHPRTKH